MSSDWALPAAADAPHRRPRAPVAGESCGAQRHLVILWTGAPWADLPDQYPFPAAHCPLRAIHREVSCDATPRLLPDSLARFMRWLLVNSVGRDEPLQLLEPVLYKDDGWCRVGSAVDSFTADHQEPPVWGDVECLLPSD